MIGNRQKGLTLLELLVAMTIFIIVVGLATGIFLLGLRGQRTVFTTQYTQENARYIIEMMAKEIRMSEINSFTATSLDITHPVNGDVDYQFLGTSLERNGQAINSDEARITNGRFSINDTYQPRVTVKMTVTDQAGKNQIDLQITLSSRNYQ